MGIKHDASYRSGENMAKKTDEELGSARKVTHFGSWPSMER